MANEHNGIVVTDLADREVDTELDAELRALLSLCFPNSPMPFAERRYARELPRHRWLVRNAEGELVGHAAIHDRRVAATVGELRVAGVSEVCVHPSCRGRGLVGFILGQVHDWSLKQGFAFAMLFGRPKVYRGSGYQVIENPLRYWDEQQKQWKVEVFDTAMVHALGDSSAALPSGEIDLRGMKF